jgi:vacuolar-type H+-ATPase subunit F/Vma7
MSDDATFSLVQLSVKCTELADLDLFPKSDPMCALFSRKKDDWVEEGRTEIVRDSFSPKFTKTFVLQYHFEEKQLLKICVYNVDSDSKDLAQHNFIGEAEFSLVNVIVAGTEFVMHVTRPGDTNARGKVHVVVEEAEESKTDIEFTIHGNNLDKKDFFGKSDPYLEISRGREDGSCIIVYKTEVLKKTMNPKWKPFTVSGQKLCKNDHDRPLKFTVWGWDRNGTPDLIGHSTTSVRALLGDEKSRITALDVIEPARKAKKGWKYKNSGVLQFKHCRNVISPTFLDFIRGGCTLSLMVAIDFTASNGDPNLPSSLHYQHPNEVNEYAQIITSVCNIITPYTSDQWFPAWGFGAKLPPSNRISHCFALSGNNSNPEVRGLKGIMDAYEKTLKQARFHGPTILSQVLSSAIHQVRSNFTTQKNQQYHVLLIITDDVISDLQDTTDRIVEASDMPLSIVIVGVGGADFKSMHVLNGNGISLQSRFGKVASRGIVQFVPLRESKSRTASFSLSREMLAWIPHQLTSFMKFKGFHPNPPRQFKREQSLSSLRAKKSSSIVSAPPQQVCRHPSYAPASYQTYPRDSARTSYTVSSEPSAPL